MAEETHKAAQWRAAGWFWAAPLLFLFIAFALLLTTGCGGSASAASSGSNDSFAAVVAISPPTLPNGTQGSSYTSTFSATGGTAPYDWLVSAGALPTGLALNSQGVLSGTPSLAANYSFTVKVQDSSVPARTTTQAYKILIGSGTKGSSGNPLSVATNSLPAAMQNDAYNADLNAAGGSPPYSWTLTSGSLPSGLNLSSNGEISGTPTRAEQSTFTVEVKDAVGDSASAQLQLQVNAANAGVTWYVRPDGGTRYSANVPSGQCDGQADAPYPGIGSNQHCAFNDYRYLYSDGTYNNKAWVISGGDTVMVRGGPWRVGQSGPNPQDYFGDDPGDPYDAFNPTIPSGTASQHTRILGENYAQCAAQTQLFGGYAVAAVLNLKGAQFVDVQCLEITDHAQCTRLGTPAYPSQCNSSYPLDDYANSGVFTDVNTRDVLLQDVNIHGTANNGIIGPIGGTITATRVRIAYNGGAGWNFDDGNGTASVNGQVNASYLTVEWNGCNEEYPITDAYPAISCYDDNSAGYGDGVGTPNTPLNFTCDHCMFRYNTQDGFDLLHVSGSNITVTNTASYGNMGQQYKLGAMTNILFQNSLAITNCLRMSAPFPGAPASYNQYLSDFCRAAGDGFAINLAAGGVLTLQNNSVVGYSATTFDIGCGGSDCSASSMIFENNIVLGYSNPNYNSGQYPGLFYFESGIGPNQFTSRSHNIYLNVRNSGCPSTGFPDEFCVDPLFVNEPSTYLDEATFDNFDFTPSAGSPAVGAGVYVPGLTTDYAGNNRPNPPSIGALE